MNETKKEPKKARKPRHDKGTIKANDRDIYVLTWVANMYAVCRFSW